VRSILKLAPFIKYLLLVFDFLYCAQKKIDSN